MAKKLVQIIVDGMTPAAFERGVETGRAPALAFLAEHGRYEQAVSVFPSLTPVCLSSIVTGGGPDVHQIPHLVWWHRGEQRIVEYGSSFAALRAAGMAQSITDTIFNMNERHLSRDAVTLFEAIEDAGLVSAAVNITCYRGRVAHKATLPWVTRLAYGPQRFFYYSLFESDPTGAPFAVRNRAGGSVDAYAASVGRWLVTRDGFDFFTYYLSDFDYTSHLYGPSGAEDVALERTDAAIQSLFDAAGGGEAFLDRYAVVLHSDHGQTEIRWGARIEERVADIHDQVVVTASNRAGQIYLLPDARLDAEELAARFDGDPSVDVTLRQECDRLVARRDGSDADVEELEHPDAVERARAALANPNAGDLLLSAAEGWEFADIGGRFHVGGGSHGSLVAGDSLVPVVTVGVDAPIARITDVAPAVLEHLGVHARVA